MNERDNFTEVYIYHGKKRQFIFNKFLITEWHTNDKEEK